MRSLLAAIAIVMPAAASGADFRTPVQGGALYGMVEIEQRANPGIQTLTMLSGPYRSAAECEIFRSRYTSDRVKAGDRIVSSTCDASALPDSVFAILLRGRPFSVVVFEDGPNLMAIGNPALQVSQLNDICGRIRAQLNRGTCHRPEAGPSK